MPPELGRPAPALRLAWQLRPCQGLVIAVSVDPRSPRTSLARYSHMSGSIHQAPASRSRDPRDRTYEASPRAGSDVLRVTPGQVLAGEFPIRPRRHRHARRGCPRVTFPCPAPGPRPGSAAACRPDPGPRRQGMRRSRERAAGGGAGGPRRAGRRRGARGGAACRAAGYVAHSGRPRRARRSRCLAHSRHVRPAVPVVASPRGPDHRRHTAHLARTAARCRWPAASRDHRRPALPAGAPRPPDPGGGSPFS